MEQEELQKLLDIVRKDDRYDYIIRCIVSDILHQVSIIKSTLDLITKFPNEISYGFRSETQLAIDACLDIQKITDEAMIKVLISRLLDRDNENL